MHFSQCVSKEDSIFSSWAKSLAFILIVVTGLFFLQLEHIDVWCTNIMSQADKKWICSNFCFWFLNAIKGSSISLKKSITFIPQKKLITTWYLKFNCKYVALYHSLSFLFKKVLKKFGKCFENEMYEFYVMASTFLLKCRIKCMWEIFLITDIFLIIYEA